MFGTETAEAAVALGVPPRRIATIAAGPDQPAGTRPSTVFDATPGDLVRITDAIVAGTLTIPVARTFPLGRIREAVEMQAGRHIHGKIIIVP